MESNILLSQTAQMRQYIEIITENFDRIKTELSLYKKLGTPEQLATAILLSDTLLTILREQGQEEFIQQAVLRTAETCRKHTEEKMCDVIAKENPWMTSLFEPSPPDSSS